jgi:hypothetical protein
MGAYWHGATLLGPDARTLRLIQAEPQSGPQSFVRFAPICAHVFGFSFFLYHANYSSRFTSFSFLKELEITILRNSQNAKAISRRSSRDCRKRSDENKFRPHSARRASWLTHPPHADLLRPRRCAVYEVSSVVEDFRDPPFVRSFRCPQPGLDSWRGSGINGAYD